VRGHLVDDLAPPIYAAIDFVVILAPALAVKIAADRGGMGDAEGTDLIVASIVLGTMHAVMAWSRLRHEERTAIRRLDMWIAAVDALVVLALGGALLLVGILYGFADEHASLVDRGYPVVALWTGIQVLAVAAAEVTARAVFWWLEPHQARTARRDRARTARRDRAAAMRSA
jgi:predicted Co/Zn/Cd cation transporter (cation efflux family)